VGLKREATEMTGLDVLILLVVALVAGLIGQAIAGYSAGGLLGSIAVGFIGALLGIWIAREMHLPELFLIKVGSQTFPLIWSIIGAAVFLAIIKLVAGSANTRHA
jgi:uncharacterized membrane protein YeaQ/YmgE (transglycosylase-associated protein family)